MISLDVTKLTSPKLNDFLWISMVSKNIRAIRAHRELNEIVRIQGIEIGDCNQDYYQSLAVHFALHFI